MLILAVEFKVESQGEMVGQTQPYRCFDPVARAYLDCNYGLNGFFFELGNTSTFTSCASRMQRKRGCEIRMTDEKF